MKYDIRSYSEGIYILKATGTIRDGDREIFLRHLKSRCFEDGIDKVIIDLNDSKADTTYLEDFNFGSYVSIIMSGLKVAVYMQGEGKAEMVNEAARVRGLTTGVFSSLKEAEKWLKGF